MADCGRYAATIVHSLWLWIVGHAGPPDLSRCGAPVAVEEMWTRLARAQHGVISRGQLSRCGQSPAQIARLIRRGLLIRQCAGVYRAAPAQASFESALWVAVLATRGVLGGTTASYLWGMVEQHSGPIRITVPPWRAPAIPAGVRVLRRELGSAPSEFLHGLPVAGRALAAIDHLITLPVGEACAFTDRALQCGWISRQHLLDRLSRQRHGNRPLRRVLARLVDGAEAQSERLLHRLLRANGITGWVGNYRVLVGGVVRARIDVAFVDLRIAIEVDGFAYHSDRERFQRDRTRQNLLVGLGWTVLRFTWADLHDRPDHVIAVIIAQLAKSERF
jgi:very-short-patch-repair endonuclease